MTSTVLVPEEIAANKINTFSYLMEFAFQLKETIVKKKILKVTSCGNGYEQNRVL